VILKLLRCGVAAMLVLGPAAAAASEAVDEALSLMNQGQYEQALQKLESHLNAAPQDAEARFTRGLALVRLNRVDEAIRSFSDLTRDYPQLPEPYNNLAVLYAQRGEYEKARDALEAALANHPGYGIAHENLGDIYAALATSAYNRALTLEPNNTSVRAKANLLVQLEGLADSGAAITARPMRPAAALPGEPAAPGAVNAKDADAVNRLLQDWAAAWSAKDVEKYLSFYADDFTPEGGQSRQTWAEQRKNRIAKPRSIRVGVSGVQLSMMAGDRVQAIFQQDYQSDVLTNRAGKVLELKNRDGNWRIVREYSR